MPGHAISRDLPTDAVLYAALWSNGEPFIRLRSASEPSSGEAELIGRRFSYRVSPDARRWCLGHRPLGGDASLDIDCTATPETGSRYCPRCAAKEAGVAANLHHAHTRERGGIDQATQYHMMQTNFLYLAGFRDGSIKVGTSTQARLPTRLAEQGAWQASIVAKAEDGYAVRDVEDRVTMELGLPQAVSARRKLDGFENPIEDEMLQADLRGWTRVVHDLLDTMRDPRLVAEHEAWETPVAGHAIWKRVHRYPLDLGAGSHDFTVNSVCGRYIAMTRPGGSDVFVADLAAIYGVQLDVGDYGSDEVVVQDSLF